MGDAAHRDRSVGRSASRRGRRVAAACAGAAILALAGCGSGDEEPRLSARSAGELRELLGEVRDAAEADDRSGALSAINRFEALLGRLAERDGIAGADLRVLRLGAQRIERRIGTEVQPPEPEPESPPPAATPESQPAPQAKPPKGSKGKSKGKGKGKR